MLRKRMRHARPGPRRTRRRAATLAASHDPSAAGPTAACCFWRRYGCSTGKPTASQTLADIAAVLRCLQAELGKRPEDTVLYGQSGNLSYFSVLFWHFCTPGAAVSAAPARAGARLRPFPARQGRPGPTPHLLTTCAAVQLVRGPPATWRLPRPPWPASCCTRPSCQVATAGVLVSTVGAAAFAACPRCAACQPGATLRLHTPAPPHPPARPLPHRHAGAEPRLAALARRP